VVVVVGVEGDVGVVCEVCFGVVWVVGEVFEYYCVY